MIRCAGWPEVRQKGWRLLNSGAIHPEVLTPERFIGKVDGEHGTYHVTIDASLGADMPKSWTCECLWGYWSKVMTRWHLRGRMCSHAYAASIYFGKNKPKTFDESVGGNLTEEPRPNVMQSPTGPAQPVPPSPLGAPTVIPGPSTTLPIKPTQTFAMLTNKVPMSREAFSTDDLVAEAVLLSGQALQIVEYDIPRLRDIFAESGMDAVSDKSVIHMIRRCEDTYYGLAVLTNKVNNYVDESKYEGLYDVVMEQINEYKNVIAIFLDWFYREHNGRIDLSLDRRLHKDEINQIPTTQQPDWFTTDPQPGDENLRNAQSNSQIGQVMDQAMEWYTKGGAFIERVFSVYEQRGVVPPETMMDIGVVIANALYERAIWIDKHGGDGYATATEKFYKLADRIMRAVSPDATISRIQEVDEPTATGQPDWFTLDEEPGDENLRDASVHIPGMHEVKLTEEEKIYQKARYAQSRISKIIRNPYPQRHPLYNDAENLIDVLKYYESDENPDDPSTEGFMSGLLYSGLEATDQLTHIKEAMNGIKAAWAAFKGKMAYVNVDYGQPVEEIAYDVIRTAYQNVLLHYQWIESMVMRRLDSSNYGYDRRPKYVTKTIPKGKHGDEYGPQDYAGMKDHDDLMWTDQDSDDDDGGGGVRIGCELPMDILTHIVEDTNEAIKAIDKRGIDDVRGGIEHDIELVKSIRDEYNNEEVTKTCDRVQGYLEGRLSNIRMAMLRGAPFASPKQEIFMRLNHPDIYRKWLDEHGHAKGFREYCRKTMKRFHAKRSRDKS